MKRSRPVLMRGQYVEVVPREYDDWEDFYFILNSNLELTNAFGGCPAEWGYLTTEEEKAYVEGTLMKKDGRYFTVLERGEKRVIGALNLFEINRLNRTARISFWTDPDLPMNAIVEAVGFLPWFAFRQLNLRKLIAFYADHNQIAKKAYAKLGFREVGRLRDHVWDSASLEYRDLIIVELFREDYRKPG